MPLQAGLLRWVSGIRQPCVYELSSDRSFREQILRHALGAESATAKRRHTSAWLARVRATHASREPMPAI